MTMKQTQTKYFNCSDFGLDMCFGAVNKNPGNFKKILTEGYNEQVVSSVAINGNQVVFTYGGAHGYAANRILKVDSGGLSLINNGEFWIDSVTDNTVVFTLDGAPISALGSFTTRIAPLGWDLVYEVGNIHIYEMLHIDDTPRYVRMCFETSTSSRASVAVCIGKTYDPTTGFIDDPDSLQSTRSITSPTAANLPKWDTYTGGATYANYTYSQGFSGIFGHGAFVGSLYHIGFQCGDGFKGSSDIAHHIFGIFPAHTLPIENLQYPLLVGIVPGSSGVAFQTGQASGNFSTRTGANGHGSIGNFRVQLDFSSVASGSILTLNSNHPIYPISPYLPSSIEEFNTSTLMPFQIYHYDSSQFLGNVSGIYRLLCTASSTPPYTATQSPSIDYTSDLDTLVLLCVSGGNASNTTNTRCVALPVEPVKYVGV